MSADELIDKQQNDTIARLQSQLETIQRDAIELSEKRRGWVRVGMIGWFCALISYVVIRYTGVNDGEIKPDIIWSFGTGILVTKLLDHYINSGTKSDRML